MAAARSVKTGVYHSDILADDYIRRVDDHLVTQAVLGWALYDGTPPLVSIPRGVRPRHGVGVDASGRSHSVVVATTGADLWTRTSVQWKILDDAGALTDVTLTGLVGEAVTIPAISA
jgi:hypothetical protein